MKKGRRPSSGRDRLAVTLRERGGGGERDDGCLVRKLARCSARWCQCVRQLSLSATRRCGRGVSFPQRGANVSGWIYVDWRVCVRVCSCAMEGAGRATRYGRRTRASSRSTTSTSARAGRGSTWTASSGTTAARGSARTSAGSTWNAGWKRTHGVDGTPRR